MRVFDRKIPLILLIGDILCFVVALWLTLLIRYGELPAREMFINHLVPFSFLFFFWILVFFIAGLYEKPNTVLRAKLRDILVNAQIVNTLIAIIFFYFVSSPNITPKTNLFLYILVSFALLFWWRTYGNELSGARRQERALLLGGGKDMRDLRDEVNGSAHYNIRFVSVFDVEETGNPVEKIIHEVTTNKVSVLVVDLHNEKVKPFLPDLYKLIYSKIRFIDMKRVYEDVFDRVPLSLLKETWLLEHISIAPKTIYDPLKRIMDVVISLVLGIITLPFYPLIAIFIRFDKKGPIFSIQERVGKDNELIRLFKFRTMEKANDGGIWGAQNDNRVTRVGVFLRKTRLDELPQLWNVLLGDISLIGPRPEFLAAVRSYEKDISYYSVRHLIKPGLSGWAQIRHKNHPHHGIKVDETKEKLSYDLYYIKNRSLILDLGIALKTAKELVSRKGV